MRIRQSGNIFSSYGSIACLVFIWVFAFILSSPLFFFNIYKPLLLLNVDSKDIVLAPPADLLKPSSSSSSSSASNASAAFSSYSSRSSFNNDHNTNVTSFTAYMLPYQSDTTGSSPSSGGDSIIIDDDLLAQIDVAHCIENSPFHQSRLIYSYTSLIIQYVLPILIVGIAYGSIWWKLKKQRDKLKSHHQTNNQSVRTYLTLIFKHP